MKQWGQLKDEAIANNGDLAGEFLFLLTCHFDQGFSFYDAYAKIPTAGI